MESPALSFKSFLYPVRYRGKVPKRIRMNKTVVDEHAKIGYPVALVGHEYECFVDSHGSVFAIVQGNNLIVGYKDFEVVEYHS